MVTVKKADLSNVYGIYEKTVSALENEQQKIQISK